MGEGLRSHIAWRRLLRSRRASVGLAILICVFLVALFAPWLAPYDPLEQHLLERRQPPSMQHPLGLDELGRDNLSRIIYGARLSLQVGSATVLLAVAVGGVLGIVAGYWGGWPGSLIMSLMDVMLAFPTLLLAIAVVVVLGRGLTSVIYAIAFTAIPTYARLMRVGIVSTKERDYVLAARSIGASPMRLLWRHILPACLVPLLAQATLGVGTAILEAAGLSFLGLGAQPPTPEWGAMLGQGRGAIFAAPHIVLFPGLAIMLTVLGFNLLGDGAQSVLDPWLDHA
jgi:peptide/nickel transport system permease protein